MTPFLVRHAFQGEKLDKDFRWLNEPAEWRLCAEGLEVKPEGNTDF